MKKLYQASLTIVLFGMITAMSILFFSCDPHAPREPLGDPCKEVKKTCNDPYEVPVQTANTVCQCQCAPGFSGPDCTEFDHGNCEYVNCINGGVRNNDGGYCYCNCPEGWGGEFCEIPTTACSGVECPVGQAPNPELDCECV